MNKIFLILLLFVSQFAFAQQSKPPSTTLENPGDCPVGMCPMAYISLDALNFHKPRTNCLDGFGLCVRVSWGITCTSCFGKSSVVGNSVTIWSTTKEKTAELHIPVDIKNQKGFEKVNFGSFEIEDNSIAFKHPNGKVQYAKGGVYSTVVKNNEYVITVSLL